MSRIDAQKLPQNIQMALERIGEHPIREDEAAKPDHVCAALTALSKLLNGKPAAENTATREARG
ncbi:hypothetical protein ABZ351_07735 [Streptomyces microflavus]|uniref:hypothetical protein n=1 Tax=Streptomyces microflavus TaxID=1919 RepID=UPI003408C194